MAHTCPHCSKNIEDAFSKAALDAKAAEATELKTQLVSVRETAAAAAAAVAERDQLRGELTKRDQAAERSAAFGELGIPDGVRGGFEVIYGSEMAGQAAAKPFKDWLIDDTTKAHPLLASHYRPAAAAGDGAAAAGGAAAATGAGAGAGAGAGGARTIPAQGGLTHTDRGAASAGSIAAPKTAAEIGNYLRSAEYRALPIDKQREAKAALKATVTK